LNRTYARSASQNKAREYSGELLSEVKRRFNGKKENTDGVKRAFDHTLLSWLPENKPNNRLGKLSVVLVLHYKQTLLVLFSYYFIVSCIFLLTHRRLALGKARNLRPVYAFDKCDYSHFVERVENGLKFS